MKNIVEKLEQMKRRTRNMDEQLERMEKMLKALCQAYEPQMKTNRKKKLKVLQGGLPRGNRPAGLPVLPAIHLT